MKRLFLLLALIPGNCLALTLSDIRTDVRSLVTDGQGTRQRFTNTELNGWINEGQKIVDAKSRCTYKATQMVLSAGTTFYDLPSDYMFIRRVTRDRLAIQELSPAALDGRSAEWENASGLPTYYFINFSSRTKIGFAPFPNAAVDTATINVEYIAYSPTLSSDSDVPFSGIVEFYPYHYSLVYYAAFKASIVDERYDKAKVFMESFSPLVDLMKTSCIDRINYLPSAIGKNQ